MPLNFRARSTVLQTIKAIEREYPEGRSGRRRTHRLIFENFAPYAAWVHLRKGFFVINARASVGIVKGVIDKTKGAGKPFPYNRDEMRAILRRAGKQILQWHKEVSGGKRQGGWRDRTGRLAASYRYKVDSEEWRHE